MIFKRIENIKDICKNKRLEPTHWKRKVFVSGFNKSGHNYYKICFNNGSAFHFNYAFLKRNGSNTIIFMNERDGMLHIAISKK